jgi:hypothetical protein
VHRRAWVLGHSIEERRRRRRLEAVTEQDVEGYGGLVTGRAGGREYADPADESALPPARVCRAQAPGSGGEVGRICVQCADPASRPHRRCPLGRRLRLGNRHLDTPADLIAVAGGDGTVRCHPYATRAKLASAAHAAPARLREQHREDARPGRSRHRRSGRSLERRNPPTLQLRRGSAGRGGDDLPRELWRARGLIRLVGSDSPHLSMSRSGSTTSCSHPTGDPRAR